MRLGRPVPADESAGPPARRPDRTHRLITVTAAVLLVGGLITVAATGLNWWSRIHRIEVSQAKLVRAVDAEWPRTGQGHQTAGGAGNARPVPVTQGAAAQGTAAQGTAAQGTAAPSGSDPLARIHIPRLHLNLVVVEGAGEADLLRGPGHISGTPLFGQPGNVGIAGHRYPGVFWHLDQLRDGDPVIVETRDEWYVYRVSREMTVGPSDVDVLAPHPAGAPAGARDFLTLVTCDPVFTTLHRLIRQAVLVHATPRADGVPSELATS
jgi:sortase A